MATTKRAKELADEILRPLRLRSGDLRNESELIGHMKSVIDRGLENTLVDRQKGWDRDKDAERAADLGAALRGQKLTRSQ